jgi:hypothetical protein
LIWATLVAAVVLAGAGASAGPEPESGLVTMCREAVAAGAPWTDCDALAGVPLLTGCVNQLAQFRELIPEVPHVQAPGQDFHLTIDAYGCPEQ